MDKDKGFDFDEVSGAEEYGSEGSTRARNRTVMLTPDITGQVRARLQHDVDAPPPPLSRTVEPGSGTQGFGIKPGFVTPVMQAPVAARPVPVPPPVIERTAAAAPAASTEGAIWANETPLVGFLVSYDHNKNGDVFHLRTGRLIVTSEAQSGGSYLLIKDESVSPMHAIMRVSPAGEIQILDQLSEFGTRIRRFGSDEEIELSGEKSSVEHGDTLLFGSRMFHVCLVVRSEGA